jgi:ribosome biogenesis GTPase
MRELKLTGDEGTVAAQFDDIAELASACRFRDCRHRGEPGCAVEAAIAAGTLERERLEHFLKLDEELGRTSDAATAARKANEKVRGRALNKRLVDKYGAR